MCTIVVSKLCQWQQRCLVVLLIIDGTTQILLQNLINPFRLSICLRMKCRRKLDFYLQDLEQRLPKLGDKLRSSIRYNVIWKSMISIELSMKSFAVSSLMIVFLQGTKWAIFENRSTTTQMQSKVFDGGRSTMKSIETEDHGCLGT